MKITYLIGNGFDINLGLKTRYKDFYNYYLSLKHEDERIIDLTNQITLDIENWSDLEIALGEYTELIETTEDFDYIFEHLGDSLIDYLKKVELGFNKQSQKIDNERILNDFINPFKYLRVADKEAMENFNSKSSSNSIKINIINFNYTNTLQQLISNTKDSNRYFNSESIHHIHGTLLERMVLGVNDINQIHNENFKIDLDVTEALVKTKCNKVMRHNVDNTCKTIIQESDVICIFGSSLGKTDKFWWDQIGGRLDTNKAKLLVFHKCAEIPKTRPYKQSRLERKIREKFNRNESEHINNNIHITLNSDIFNTRFENEI